MGGHRSLSPINHVRYTLCAIGVGALVGCLVVSLGALITGLYTARVQFGLKWYEGAGDGLARVRWWHGLWRLVWIAAVYTAMAAALVAYVAPKAQGSGLPEVKGFLNGSRIPGLWRFRTFLIKFFAIALVIGAGLPVGREGAAVYLGACLAHAAWSHGNLWWQGREAATDPKNQRLFTTIGGAAGIAAAFGAPIGGVLYVFEEISSYWDERKTVLACLATAVAVMISRGFGFFAFGESAHFESLVVFRKRHSKVDGKRFTWLDLPFFVVVAIVGGLQAALVTRMMLWWTRTRAKWAQPGGWRFRRRARVAEAVALSIVISVVFYAICLLGYCKKKPQDHDDDENGVVDCPPTWAPSASGGRRLSGAVRHHRLYNCDKRGEHGEYNDLASLLLVGAEGAIKNLLTRDQDTPFRMRSLAIALPVYFLGFTSMAGTSLPMGTFVPNLLLGALAGRLLGSAFGDLVGRGLSGPGLYALMGAGAQLGGFTRVALTVTALMTEATGDVGAIAPLMLCCIIGAGVASVVTEPYDEVLLHMRRIPYLDDKDLDPECKRITAGALCARSSRLADISSVEDVAAALADDKHKSLDHFLVVGEGGRHVGVVRRRRLVRKLKGDAAASAAPDKKDGDLKRALQEAATHAHEVKEMAKKAAPKLLRFGSEMDAHDSDRRKDEESPHDRPETCRRGDDVGDSIEDAGAVDCAALVEANGPYVAREDQTMDEIFPLFHRLQLEVVVVVGLTGKAIGILERVHLVSLSLEHIERLARQAGETDAVKAETARKLQSLRKISARSLEIRAGILGYHIEGGAQGSRRSRTRSHGDLTETCPDLGECTAPEFARSSAPPRRRSMPTRLSPPPPVRGLSAGV